jgi:hypothetical protein
MPIDDTYNPSIHRINNAVRSRAVHPEDPLPEIPPQLLRFNGPPLELVERVQSKIDTLINLAEIKKGVSFVMESHHHILTSHSTAKSQRQASSRGREAYLWP